MKKSKLLGVLSLVIIALAVVMLVLDYAIPLKLWTHPILNFLAVLFLGFGIMAACLGVKRKSPWYYAIATVLIDLVILYVLLQYVIWWVTVILFIVVLACGAILSVTNNGSHTENISLNKDPEYKDYKARYAEKKAAEAEKEAKEKEDLPEIKSFKD